MPVAGQTVAGAIEIAQSPGHTSAIKGNLTGLTADTEYIVRINSFGKTGDITQQTATVTCNSTGDEFNPLAEPDNEFAEPGRGLIDPITSDANGEVTEDTFKQTDLLHNMGGPTALVGKSLSIYLKSEYDADAANDTDLATALGCCVIATDADPNAPVVDPATVTTVNWKHPHYTSHYSSHYKPSYW